MPEREPSRPEVPEVKDASVASTGSTKPACPICGRPAVEPYMPFCSRRCTDVDLSRWMTGAYSLAGEQDPDPDGQ